MMTERLKSELVTTLYDAWQKYAEVFGEPPHGTLKQLNALVELLALEAIVAEISNRAVAKWYAEGQ